MTFNKPTIARTSAGGRRRLRHVLRPSFALLALGALSACPSPRGVIMNAPAIETQAIDIACVTSTIRSTDGVNWVEFSNRFPSNPTWHWGVGRSQQHNDYYEVNASMFIWYPPAERVELHASHPRTRTKEEDALLLATMDRVVVALHEQCGMPDPSAYKRTIGYE